MSIVEDVEMKPVFVWVPRAVFALEGETNITSTFSFLTRLRVKVAKAKKVSSQSGRDFYILYYHKDGSLTF